MIPYSYVAQRPPFSFVVAYILSLSSFRFERYIQLLLPVVQRSVPYIAFSPCVTQRPHFVRS